jgi:hypothetical protein
MKLMGHSTVTVSQRYVHPSPDWMERAVGRMDTLDTRKLLEEQEVGILSGIPKASVTPAVH